MQIINRSLKVFIFGVSLLTLNACTSYPVSRDQSIPLNTVDKVDLNKYIGRWFEAYRLPNWFEDNDCNTVTAEYSIKENGDIRVLNSCYKLADQVNKADGVAYVADKTTNAKLKVSFFRPFYGDYWIVDLAPDYSWALIGEGSGKYFWILTRDQKLSPETERMLLDRAKKLGYMTDRLIKPANNIPLNK